MADPKRKVGVENTQYKLASGSVWLFIKLFHLVIMHYAEFIMTHFHQDTLIIQTIYNILQQCEQWKRQPIPLNPSSETAHFRACCGWFLGLHISNIHTAAHTTNEQTCCKENSSGSRQFGHKSSHWEEWPTWPVCSMHTEGPSSVNNGACNDYPAATVNRLASQKTDP